MMGVGGVLTIAVLALAFIGAARGHGQLGARASSSPPSPGFVTAMPLWIPAGIVIGAAALLLGHPNGRPDPTSAHPA